MYIQETAMKQNCLIFVAVVGSRILSGIVIEICGMSKNHGDHKIELCISLICLTHSIFICRSLYIYIERDHIYIHIYIYVLIRYRIKFVLRIFRLHLL